MTHDRLRDAARGALLGTFVGDALGMPFEGYPPQSFEPPLEMAEARLGRGTYTDDTQMMIALAESLLRHGAVEPDDLARAFLDAYEPERGYGGGTRAVFALWADGVRDAAGLIFDGQGSLGNGAAMRIAPIGVRFALDQALLDVQAERSARLTHAHPVGVDGAVAQASAVAAAVRGDSALEAARSAARSDELRRALGAAAALVATGLGTPAELANRLGTGVTAHESVATAGCIAEADDDFEAALTFAVACGGDTDTIAAMTGAIVGARLGASAIPDRWLDCLEDGPKGRRHVASLADELAPHRGA
jgi:poly(ADP-ribose) glycohydrolase ARH3